MRTPRICKYVMGRSARKSLTRDRANLSFFIVVIFFAIFTVIVLTEIFLIDERGRSGGVHGSRYPPSRLHHEYDDNQPSAQQAEDYLIYHAGADDSVGVSLHRGPQLPGSYLRSQMTIAPKQAAVAGNVETRLPSLGNITAHDGKWQAVTGTRYKFFVFSAYYEKRGPRAVRIIAATKTRGPERVWCRMWQPSNSSTAAPLQSISVPGRVKVIRENWNLKYSACFILCPLRDNQSVPSSVTVVSRLRMLPTNHLIVHNADSNSSLNTSFQPNAQIANIPNKMAVCVKPLHFNYSQSLKMLEFIELNSLLGINHFFFYNDTASGEISCILRDYILQKRVTVLPWKLDMLSQKEIRTEGLFAALNDCLYRTMYRYSHIALIDLDEFIVPRHNDTLQEFIQWMGKRLITRSTGSYSFQNAFFYLQWPDDFTWGGEDAFETNLMTLHKTRRRAKLHPHKQRSKYICRPEFVVEVGNHFVWEFIPGHGTLNVPSDAAIMHHYRVCEFGGDDCVKSASVVDRTMCRYRDRLVVNIRRQWSKLRSLCGLPEVRARARATPKPKNLNNNIEVLQAPPLSNTQEKS